ncbi:MAG TPA: regulatory protein RecX [Gammaproteobacteria bacterium]|nr:regulatory protein RecX [Gammaproteobacteria bacterium]
MEPIKSKPADIEKVRACALRLLARREHSRTELVQKLLLRHFSEDLIHAVIDSMLAKGWQSDLRFAKAYVEQQIQRGYGALKIEIELKKRGIAKELIVLVLPSDNAFWQQQLRKLWNNKFKETNKTRPVTQAQQIRFLQSRGFSWQQIKSMVLHNEK